MFQIAIPNKGSLSEGAIEILRAAGYRCKRYSRELIVRDPEHEVEFLFLRPRDIAVYVGGGVIDAGITGRDLTLDSQANVREHLGLNFGRSRFCYAVPADKDLTPDQFEGLRIATSYPHIVEADMKRRKVKAHVVRLDGAVEISVQLGVADVIADVVESGRTIVEAGLKIVGAPILQSEAVLISHMRRSVDGDLEKLIRRLEGILLAREYVLLEYDIPKDKLEAACAITPGVQSPTVSPLNDPQWMAVGAMVKRKGLNRTIDSLAETGGRAIIAHEIHTCRF